MRSTAGRKPCVIALAHRLASERLAPKRLVRVMVMVMVMVRVRVGLGLGLGLGVWV